MFQDYECPRCGYKSDHKTNIRTHFRRKNPCPGIVNPDIVLSDRIMEHVLTNRIYKPKKEPDVVKHITIQNNQMTQINNYFNKMDLGDKISLLNVEFDQCSDKVLSLVKKESKIHRSDKIGLVIEDRHVKELVGKMCRSIKHDLSDMNVLLDAKNNRMMIFDADEWSDHDIFTGARRLVEFIHDNFLNEHERYLLRCRKRSRDLREKQDIKEQILKYYRIVAAFDMEPYCFNKCDDDIFDNGSKYHACEDEFYPKFKMISETMTIAEKKTWRNLITATIRTNSKVTTMTLNKKLFELSQKDDPLLKRALGIK